MSGSLLADSFSERRINVGLKLFRIMLVADTNYQEKVSDKGYISIYLIYSSEKSNIARLEARLSQSLTSLHDIPVQIESLSLDQYLNRNDNRSMGAFIAERLSALSLEKAINKSIFNHQILFSPFEGDVEAGVLGGVSVESKVKPFINMKTLKKSEVKIKNFYLKVAKQHDE